MLRLLKPPKQCRSPQLLQATVRPSSSSSNGHTPAHNDIDSFLRYATDVQLAPETSVYVGTLYEYTVLRTLTALGMDLSRVGGRGDLGIDLRGTWTPPSAPELPVHLPLLMAVQCKVERTTTGPRYLRELEGTLNHLDGGGGGGGGVWGESSPIGLLASTSPCTTGMRRHMLLSKRPLAYCFITPYAEGGYLRQFIWNSTVARLVGHQVGVTTRYIPVCGDDGVEDGVQKVRKEAVLTLSGRIV